jgi:N6-adenosine-specific RNA methylase IME4
MTDDEMRGMPIPSLQDEGLLFLWVTGRAMEVGRECMRVWGYTRVDELIWVKVNQVMVAVTQVYPLLQLTLFITAPTTDSHWEDGALA